MYREAGSPLSFLVRGRWRRPWGSFPGIAFSQTGMGGTGRGGVGALGLQVPDSQFRDLIFPLVTPLSSDPLWEGAGGAA